MAEFALSLMIPLALIFAHCDRGVRIPGPSWFDIPEEAYDLEAVREMHGKAL